MQQVAAYLDPHCRYAGVVPCNELERLVRGGVVFEVGDPLPDLVGTIRPEDRVDQAVELVRRAGVGERVLIVAGGKGDLLDELAFRRRG